MSSFLGTLALGYLAVCGTATAACAVGRGLLRASEHAWGGRMREAGGSVLAAAAAPAVMAYDAASVLARDVVVQARALITTTERNIPPAGR